MTGLAVALTAGPLHGVTATLATASGPGEVVLGRVVDRSRADVALFPFNTPTAVANEDDRQRLLSVVDDNATDGLRTVVAVAHDHARPVTLGQPDAVVLRTSMQASAPHSGEHAMPVLVVDPWVGEPVARRPWQDVPVVGFMGRAAGDGGLGEVRDGDAAGRVGFRRIDPADAADPVFPRPVDIGGVLRVRALNALMHSDEVRSGAVRADVVVRDHFYGHYPPSERSSMRQAFAEHLRGSDYVLCVRGYGNFSIRLFETMAMGRVPVIVESDLVLPCADVVDWDAIAVRVPLAQIDRVAEHVAVAHAQGPERFAWRQAQARAAWERWLSMDGFARYVADVILGAGRS